MKNHFNTFDELMKAIPFKIAVVYDASCKKYSRLEFVSAISKQKYQVFFLFGENGEGPYCVTRFDKSEQDGFWCYKGSINEESAFDRIKGDISTATYIVNDNINERVAMKNTTETAEEIQKMKDEIAMCFTDFNVGRGITFDKIEYLIKSIRQYSNEGKSSDELCTIDFLKQRI